MSQGTAEYVQLFRQGLIERIKPVIVQLHDTNRNKQCILLCLLSSMDLLFKGGFGRGQKV